MRGLCLWCLLHIFLGSGVGEVVFALGVAVGFLGVKVMAIDVGPGFAQECFVLCGEWGATVIRDQTYRRKGIARQVTQAGVGISLGNRRAFGVIGHRKIRGADGIER